MRNARYLLLALALALLATTPPAQSACYGPVGTRDTLWLIALELRPEPAVSPQRMMLALLEENPDAFASANVNALNAGSTVCFDASKAIELDDFSAVEEVRRHNREWESVRHSGGPEAARPEAPAMPAGANAAGSDSPRPETGFPARNGRPEGGSLDLAHSVAVFELRLATMEESLEQLGIDGPSARAMRSPELASTVEELGATLQRLLPRLERLEQTVEHLRAEVTNAGIRNELAALRSRVSALEAADPDDSPVPPGPSAELPADWEPESRLGEDLDLLGLRVAHNEERIRVLVGLLEAESEAIEVLKARLLRSLRLMSSASAPQGTSREPAPAGEAQTDRETATLPAPRDGGAGVTEPKPPTAPRDVGAGTTESSPMSASRVDRSEVTEPTSTPAPRDGDAGATEPSPPPPSPPDGSEGAMEPPPAAPPGGGGGTMEPSPTPAPQVDGSGMTEPNPTPAPRDDRTGVTDPSPTPSPPGTGPAAETTQGQPAPAEEGAKPPPVATPEPEYIRYVKVLAELASEWLTRLRDLW